MWLVKRGGERATGARLVRYSLLTLIIFMLVCTSLAIILVSFASDYSATLHDRTQGIILILLLIGFNYAIGLVALWRAQLLLLVIFALVDLVLAILCLTSTHQGHHIGNWGALVMFSLSFLLSTTVVWQTSGERSVRRTCSVQTASVNCYQHVAEDWFDYGSTSAFLSEKDELIPSQMLLPYNCHCDLASISTTLVGGIAAEEAAALQSIASAPSCTLTVESNERQFLKGDRFAV